MQIVFAAVLIAVFSALALLHIYWALGGRWALDGALPAEGDRLLFVPGPGASASVAVALFMAAALCGLQVGIPESGVPAWLPRLGVWGISFLFAARAVGEFRYVGFFKRVYGTVFARRDSQFYSPLCLAISLLAAGLALTSR